MALFIRQEDNRSKLQERLATELQEKAKARAEKADRPDGVDDSTYIEGTKKTTSLAWVWVAIVLAVIALVLVFMVSVNT